MANPKPPRPVFQLQPLQATREKEKEKDEKRACCFKLDKTQEILVDGGRKERRNKHFRSDYQRNAAKRNEMGGQALADRSMSRAEELCACFECEEKTTHSHETLENGFNCATVSIVQCRYCNKRVCGFCKVAHRSYCVKTE
jgi:hypothetical protein